MKLVPVNLRLLFTWFISLIKCLLGPWVGIVEVKGGFFYWSSLKSSKCGRLQNKKVKVGLAFPFLLGNLQFSTLFGTSKKTPTWLQMPFHFYRVKIAKPQINVCGFQFLGHGRGMGILVWPLPPEERIRRAINNFPPQNTFSSSSYCLVIRKSRV